MDMKKIGRQMSILMGISMSFCLSLTGLLSSGHFTIPSFLVNFVISTIISLIIGFFVPMKKVGDAAVEKAGLTPHTMKARLLESLISDLIYTPALTLCMTLMAYHSAVSHGQPMPPYILMFLKSLALSMVVGYILIFFLMPAFLKLLMKKNGGNQV
ncbi:MAG: hypothetical protein IJ644_07530 [Oscillospiraceae bacterium]|nr:hypothetical protein [Oscillospiraceae bacterium]